MVVSQVSPQCTGYERFYFIIMAYPGAPGLIGIIGSFIETIVMFVMLGLLLRHKASKTYAGKFAQVWFLIAAIISTFFSQTAIFFLL